MLGPVSGYTGRPGVRRQMSETVEEDPADRQRKARATPRRRRVSKRVTMTDIARAAGCSQATVSFVLNKTPGIKLAAETRERVIEAARTLGYAAPSFAHLDPDEVDAPRIEGKIGFVVDQLAT